MLLKAVLVISIIISSYCLLFDEVENDTFWSFSMFDGKFKENSRKIRGIFNQTATISVSLGNSKDSEHVIKSLSGIFQNDTKAMIVKNLSREGIERFNKSNVSAIESTQENSGSRDYYGFVIFTSLDKLSEKLLYTNPVESFLFVIEGLLEFKIDELYKALQEVWKKKKALKVFVLVYNEIYTYKPFEINDDNTQGKLSILTEDFEIENFQDLKGYILKVEVFDSVYSILKDDDPQFTGPDAEVVYLIQEQMNFTSKVFKFKL